MEYLSPNARQIQNGGAPAVNPPPVVQQNPEEINLLEYIYALVRHKKTIAGLTLLGFVLGFIAALIKGPSWVAEAVIAPKETESQKASSLSNLGAFGGLVASQLNLSGNASLDKMDLILGGRDFGAKLIEKYSFLPALYRYQWPKQYSKYWDFSTKSWKETFKHPQLLGIGEFLNKKFLKKTKDIKLNTISLKFRSKDSLFTLNLATMYVEYLNEYIRTEIRTTAKENVAYLDSQLVNVADPLLREKILGLIAIEIEKQMVVSKEAFKIIDPVYLYKSFKQKKLYPFAFAAILFFLSCLIVMFNHAFTSSDKSAEDRDLIEKIIREMPHWLRVGKK
jgi:hypothetical protein